MLMNNAETQAVAQADALKAAQTLAELWARVGWSVDVCRKTKDAVQNLSKPDMASTYNPIPTEDQRPRFVVLDDEHHSAEGTRYRPGVWHFGIKPSKADNPPTLTQHLISGPLHIEAVTFDAGGNNFGRLLRFKDTRGQWRKWAMPMEMLKGDGADLRGMLLSMGVYIDPSPTGRQLLAVYLQSQTPDRQMEAATQTGWAGDSFKAFALPDGVIGPQASKVTFQAQGLHADEYTQRGTLPGWQAAIAAPAVGNPMLVLGLCSAFAGPVLALVGMESGGLHLVGDSSTGKTTALQAACSIWGGESYRRSWRATANGLEGAAALFNDGLLALDEISECDARDVGEVVYMLGNGRGKRQPQRYCPQCRSLAQLGAVYRRAQHRHQHERGRSAHQGRTGCAPAGYSGPSHAWRMGYAATATPVARRSLTPSSVAPDDNTAPQAALSLKSSPATPRTWSSA